jgi:hypothetical protein
MPGKPTQICHTPTPAEHNLPMMLTNLEHNDNCGQSKVDHQKQNIMP